MSGSRILKATFYPSVPVLLCSLIAFAAAPVDPWMILAVGVIAAAVMGWLLHRRLKHELGFYADRLSQLKQQLVDSPGNIEIDTEAALRLLDAVRPALDDLTLTLASRVKLFLSSNEALQRSYSRFQSILGNMAEGVLLIESDGHILYCNHTAARLLGRQVREVEGKELWEVMRTPHLKQAVDEALSTGTELRKEFELPRTNSIVELSAAPLDVSARSGLVIVLHNVSELRRLERMRREFVSNVSHELKTPLTAIQAYSDTLLDGGLEDVDHSRRFVEQIQEQAERLQQLIQDMLRLARIESQADVFQLQPTSLGQIVEACVDARSTVARARKLKLSFHPFPPVESNMPLETADTIVVADPEGLRTIFDNLINNALNYTPENGDVSVHCFASQNEVLVDVIDNGIGIEREHQSRIFERFYRVDRARTRGMGGTGLGLAIVKHCVDCFGGTIELQSEPGKGTHFRVRFPRTQPPDNAGTVPATVATQLTSSDRQH